jgi:hypothetical protein
MKRMMVAFFLVCVLSGPVLEIPLSRNDEADALDPTIGM